MRVLVKMAKTLHYERKDESGLFVVDITIDPAIDPKKGPTNMELINIRLAYKCATSGACFRGKYDKSDLIKICPVFYATNEIVKVLGSNIDAISISMSYPASELSRAMSPRPPQSMLMHGSIFKQIMCVITARYKCECRYPHHYIDEPLIFHRYK